ncbi:MAG TPA: helix-turn-helix transcriptional regulator [Solirubrobacteraceae bacterium]|nr:helix-turn-helix transcriptional regulator [Solirubrobacteraceae bacterium]
MRHREHSYRTLGRAIRELRRQRRLSQDELARLSRMDRAYVGAIERGERRPTYGKVLDLADALSVAPGELVARATAPRSDDAASAQP